MRNKLGDFLAHSGVPFVHRCGIIVEIDKDESEEVFGPHFGQADLFTVETRDILHVGPGAQTTGQLVAPLVVRAYHNTRVARSGHHLVRPMLADVVERTDHVVAATNGKQVLACDLEGKIVTDVGNVVGMTSILPGAGKKS